MVAVAVVVVVVTGSGSGSGSSGSSRSRRRRSISATATAAAASPPPPPDCRFHSLPLIPQCFLVVVHVVADLLAQPATRTVNTSSSSRRRRSGQIEGQTRWQDGQLSLTGARLRLEPPVRWARGSSAGLYNTRSLKRWWQML